MELHNFSAWLFVTAVLMFDFQDNCICQQTLPVITDAVYNEENAMGKKLELHVVISGVITTTECARTCTIRRTWTPACKEFSYNPSENTCALYVTSVSEIMDPDLRLFEFPMRNRFHSIAVGDEVYSISFQNKKMQYTDASQTCQSLGGKLLEFDSLGKYAALRTIQPDLRLTSVWIGAVNHGVQGQWVTKEDGLPITDTTWLWADGEPNGGNNMNCAFIFIADLKLKAQRCSKTYQFFCERHV